MIDRFRALVDNMKGSKEKETKEKLRQEMIKVKDAVHLWANSQIGVDGWLEGRAYLGPNLKAPIDQTQTVFVISQECKMAEDIFSGSEVDTAEGAAKFFENNMNKTRYAFMETADAVLVPNDWLKQPDRWVVVAVPIFISRRDEDGTEYEEKTKYDITVVHVDDKGKSWKLMSPEEIKYRKGHETYSDAPRGYKSDPLTCPNVRPDRNPEIIELNMETNEDDVTPVWIGGAARGAFVRYNDPTFAKSTADFRRMVVNQTIAWKAVVGSAQKEAKKKEEKKTVMVPVTVGVGNK